MKMYYENRSEMLLRVGRMVWRAFVRLSVAITLFLLVVAFTPLSNLLARGLVVEAATLEKVDVIFVLGGGAYPVGVLGKSSNERFIRGMLLYKDGYGKELVFVGGSITSVASKLTHTLTRSEDSSAIDVTESAIMYDSAIRLGLPEVSLHLDRDSTHTYSNVVYAGEFIKEKGLKNCLLVTSPTHMYRVMRVSAKLGLPCSASPVVDYTSFRRSAVDRVALLREVLWEYAGLAIYKVYGYI